MAYQGVIKDTKNYREIYLSDGNTIKLLRDATEQFGFWTIHFVEGRTPDVLKRQRFTSAEKARQEVIRYVNSDYGKYATVVSEPIKKAEPVRYKREKPIEGALV